MNSTNEKHEYVQRFFEFCRESLDNAKTYMPLITKRIKEANETYVSSEVFKNLLEETRRGINSDSRKSFVFIRDCLNELKAYTTVKSKNSSHTDETSKKRKRHDNDDNDDDDDKSVAKHSKTSKYSKTIVEPEQRSVSDSVDKTSITTNSEEDIKDPDVDWLQNDSETPPNQSPKYTVTSLSDRESKKISLTLEKDHDGLTLVKSRTPSPNKRKSRSTSPRVPLSPRQAHGSTKKQSPPKKRSPSKQHSPKKKDLPSKKGSPTKKGSPNKKGSPRKKESSPKKGSNKQLKKLERLLEKLSAEIEKCKDRELSLDDLDQADSYYMYEDKLQKKLLKVFKKICEVKGRSDDTGRYVESDYTYHGTRYPEINRRVSRLINKTKAFPDYHDVLSLVKRVNQKHGLMLSTPKLDRLSRDMFEEIGTQLKQRRQMDLKDTMGYSRTDKLVKLREDPAEKDVQLRQKLAQNRKMGHSNMDEVMKKYTKKQTDLKLNPDADDQSESESNEEDDQSDNENCQSPKNDSENDDDDFLAEMDSKAKSSKKAVSDDNLMEIASSKDGESAEERDFSDLERPESRSDVESRSTGSRLSVISVKSAEEKNWRDFFDFEDGGNSRDSFKSDIPDQKPDDPDPESDVDESTMSTKFGKSLGLVKAVDKNNSNLSSFVEEKNSDVKNSVEEIEKLSQDRDEILVEEKNSVEEIKNISPEPNNDFLIVIDDGVKAVDAKTSPRGEKRRIVPVKIPDSPGMAKRLALHRSLGFNDRVVSPIKIDVENAKSRLDFQSLTTLPEDPIYLSPDKNDSTQVISNPTGSVGNITADSSTGKTITKSKCKLKKGLSEIIGNLHTKQEEKNDCYEVENIEQSLSQPSLNNRNSEKLMDVNVQKKSLDVNMQNKPINVDLHTKALRVNMHKKDLHLQKGKVVLNECRREFVSNEKIYQDVMAGLLNDQKQKKVLPKHHDPAIALANKNVLGNNNKNALSREPRHHDKKTVLSTQTSHKNVIPGQFGQKNVISGHSGSKNILPANRGPKNVLSTHPPHRNMLHGHSAPKNAIPTYLTSKNMLSTHAGHRNVPSNHQKNMITTLPQRVSSHHPKNVSSHSRNVLSHPSPNNVSMNHPKNVISRHSRTALGNNYPKNLVSQSEIKHHRERRLKDSTKKSHSSTKKDLSSSNVVVDLTSPVSVTKTCKFDDVTDLTSPVVNDTKIEPEKSTTDCKRKLFTEIDAKINSITKMLTDNPDIEDLETSDVLDVATAKSKIVSEMVASDVVHKAAISKDITSELGSIDMTEELTTNDTLVETSSNEQETIEDNTNVEPSNKLRHSSYEVVEICENSRETLASNDDFYENGTEKGDNDIVSIIDDSLTGSELNTPTKHTHISDKTSHLTISETSNFPDIPSAQNCDNKSDQGNNNITFDNLFILSPTLSDNKISHELTENSQSSLESPHNDLVEISTETKSWAGCQDSDGKSTVDTDNVECYEEISQDGENLEPSQNEEMEITQESEVVEIDQESEVAEIAQETEVMEINQESVVVEIDQESVIAEINQEPEVMEINHESEVTEMNHESEIMDINQESEVVEINHESKVASINQKSEMNQESEMNRESEINQEVASINQNSLVTEINQELEEAEIHEESELGEINSESEGVEITEDPKQVEITQETEESKSVPTSPEKNFKELCDESGVAEIIDDNEIYTEISDKNQETEFIENNKDMVNELVQFPKDNELNECSKDNDIIESSRENVSCDNKGDEQLYTNMMKENACLVLPDISKENNSFMKSTDDNEYTKISPKNRIIKIAKSDVISKKDRRKISPKNRIVKTAKSDVKPTEVDSSVVEILPEENVETSSHIERSDTESIESSENDNLPSVDNTDLLPDDTHNNTSNVCTEISSENVPEVDSTSVKICDNLELSTINDEESNNVDKNEELPIEIEEGKSEILEEEIVEDENNVENIPQIDVIDITTPSKHYRKKLNKDDLENIEYEIETENYATENYETEENNYLLDDKTNYDVIEITTPSKNVTEKYEDYEDSEQIVIEKFAIEETSFDDTTNVESSSQIDVIDITTPSKNNREKPPKSHRDNSSVNNDSNHVNNDDVNNVVNKVVNKIVSKTVNKTNGIDSGASGVKSCDTETESDPKIHPKSEIDDSTNTVKSVSILTSEDPICISPLQTEKHSINRSLKKSSVKAIKKSLIRGLILDEKSLVINKASLDKLKTNLDKSPRLSPVKRKLVSNEIIVLSDSE